MDSFDQLQSMNEQFREKLVYAVTSYDETTKSKKTKYELTYIGIKQLILEMSQKGQAMIIIENSAKVERKSISANDPMQDVWYAEIKHKNIQTGQESWGVSEAYVFPWGNYPKLDQNGKKQWINENGKNKLVTEYKQEYDTFGRTGAVAKATRNSLRQQLPEMAIQLFVEEAMKKHGDKAIQNIEVDDDADFCKCNIPATKLDGTCNTCHKLVKKQ